MRPKHTCYLVYVLEATAISIGIVVKREFRPVVLSLYNNDKFIESGRDTSPLRCHKQDVIGSGAVIYSTAAHHYEEQ